MVLLGNRIVEAMLWAANHDRIAKKPNSMPNQEHWRNARTVNAENIKDPAYRKSFQNQIGFNSTVGSDWCQFRLTSYPIAVPSMPTKNVAPIPTPDAIVVSTVRSELWRRWSTQSSGGTIRPGAQAIADCKKAAFA